MWARPTHSSRLIVSHERDRAGTETACCVLRLAVIALHCAARMTAKSRSKVPDFRQQHTLESALTIGGMSRPKACLSANLGRRDHSTPRRRRSSGCQVDASRPQAEMKYNLIHNVYATVAAQNPVGSTGHVAAEEPPRMDHFGVLHARESATY